MSKPVVLFLCTGNAARSQMAEAFLRKYAGDEFDVRSAGTKPNGINPLTIQVMQEVDIDLSSHRSKSVLEYLGLLPLLSILVTVCKVEDLNCPTSWPGMPRLLAWPFDDPAAGEGTDEERLSRFRTVRDQIERKVKDWLEEIRSPRGN